MQQKYLFILVICIQLLCLPTQAQERIDEIGYYLTIKNNCPGLLSNTKTCVAALRLKPMHRQRLLSNCDSPFSIREQEYTSSQEQADLKWIDENQHLWQTFSESYLLRRANYNLNQFVGYINGRPGGFVDPNGLTYKIFFELRDFQNDLTPQTYMHFVQTLSQRGFVGDSKMPLTLGETRFSYNNIIIHAASPEQALRAEKIGIEFFGNNLAHIARGLDVYFPVEVQDWHHYLCSCNGNFSALTKRAIDFVNYRDP